MRPVVPFLVAVVLWCVSFSGSAHAEDVASSVRYASLSPSSSIERVLQLAHKGDFAGTEKYIEVPAGYSEARKTDFILRVTEKLDLLLSREMVKLSSEENGTLDDDLPIDKERFYKGLDARGKEVEILLKRFEKREEAEEETESWWGFSADNARKLLEIASPDAESTSLESLLPDELREIDIAGTTASSLLSLLILGSSGIFLGWIFRGVIFRISRRFSPEAVEACKGFRYPLQIWITLALLKFGLSFLEISYTFRQDILRVFFILAMIAVYWFLLIGTKLTGKAFGRYLDSTSRSGARALLPLARRVLNTLVGIIVVLYLVDGLGFDITAILAGLGVGGIAIALASQKTIENLFGGIVLFLDQPVKVGQFGKFGEILGTIEDIGIRSTRIRTLTRTVVSVPNADLIQMKIENLAVRDRLLFHRRLSIRKDSTPNQVRFLLASIRKLLLSHEMISSDPAQVRFVEFTEGALDLEIFCYVSTSDWPLFLAVQEDLLLRLMECVTEAGTYLASPLANNIPFVQGGGLLPLKPEKADAAIAEWRERGEIPLPDYPEFERLKWRGAIRFPGEDSWLRKIDA